jgi:hypothetical protein
MQNFKSAELLGSSIIYSHEKDLVRETLRKNIDSFYVYLLGHPNGIPFYVGKGKKDRVFCHEANAINTHHKSYKLNTIRALHKGKLPVYYYIDSFHSSEAEAHSRERFLIQSIGRHDLKTGPLTNLTDGGEGASNPSEESRQKHRDTLYGTEGEDERCIANRFFMKLIAVESVPIKPANNFKAEVLSPMNKPLKNFTPRMAAALAASAIANRIVLEEGCIIPRQLFLEDKEYLIENGVGKDILKVEMASIIFSPNPRRESFKVFGRGIDYILQNIDNALLLDAGVMMPSVK